MNSPTPKEEFVYIHMIAIYIVALNMSDMVHQHNYGEINIDDPVAKGFYVTQFISMPYTLHYSR